MEFAQINKISKLLGLIACSLLFSLFTNTANAASFSFEPSTLNLTVASPLNVAIIIDTQGVETTGADAVISFDPSAMVIYNVQGGSAYDIFPATIVDSEQGKVQITGHVSSVNQRFSGRATFATFSITPLKAGNYSLDFDYTPGNRNDTNVTSIETGDVLDILTQATDTPVTIAASGTGGTSNSNTGTTTTTTTSTTTSSPSPTPKTIFHTIYRTLTGGNTAKPVPTPTFSPDGPLPKLTPIINPPDLDRPLSLGEDELTVTDGLPAWIKYGLLTFALIVLFIIVIVFIKKRPGSGSTPPPPHTTPPPPTVR
jgi:hypothetical protein